MHLLSKGSKLGWIMSAILSTLVGVAIMSAVWATGALHTAQVTAKASSQETTPIRVATPGSRPNNTPTVTCGFGSNYVVTSGVGQITPGSVDVGNHCDDCTTPITLPFTFYLYDRPFNTAVVSSNGNLQFGSNSDDYAPVCLPASNMSFALFPYWADICTGNCPDPCVGCGIYTSVSGAANSRIFNIEWRTNHPSNGSLRANFEIRLYETASPGQTPGRIDFVYGRVDQQGSHSTVGVQGSAGDVRYMTQYECLGSPVGVDEGLLISLAPAICPSPTATPTNTRTRTPCPMNFRDVSATDFFFEAVRYMYCGGVISGYSDNTFRPNSDTTRAQLAKIIVLARGWRLECPAGNGHFVDVPPGNVFYCFVETAYARGIISGYSDGTFRPGINVSRGQLSKIVVLSMGWDVICPQRGRFVDVLPGNVFHCFVETAYVHNAISGYDDGTFLPNNNATRGQISAIVYRAINSR